MSMRNRFCDNENVLKLGCGDSCITLNLLKDTELYILND